MKSGDKVRVVTPTITGKVVERKINDDVIQCLVEYKGEDKETHQRWFDEDSLEVVK